MSAGRAAWVALAALACSGPADALQASSGPLPESPSSDARDALARGRELMARFECARCHEGTGLPTEPLERQCVGCHQAIRAGTFDAPAAHQRRWRESLHSMNDTPSLAGLGGRLRREWIASFLVAPHDIRPDLAAMMPRLPLSAQEAEDIAVALTHGASEDEEPRPSGDIDAAPGLALIEERGCLACHAFSGALDASPVQGRTPARELAPDLRRARDRMTSEMLHRWLRAPRGLMPNPNLSELDRGLIVDAILGARLAPLPAASIPNRLPVLERPVRFAEIAERVLSRSCWHCHADPDFARGDGGAGNTGGFGYSARGVNLLDHAGISSGYIADDGERRSLFARDEDGTPHLIRVLMARHAEIRGDTVSSGGARPPRLALRARTPPGLSGALARAPIPGVTGMPLGLPALSLEEIQLVETWIAQGRPN